MSFNFTTKARVCIIYKLLSFDKVYFHHILATYSLVSITISKSFFFTYFVSWFRKIKCNTAQYLYKVYANGLCWLKRNYIYFKSFSILHEIKRGHKVARWTCEILHPMRTFLRNIIPPYGTIICIKAHQKYIE